MVDGSEANHDQLFVAKTGGRLPCAGGVDGAMYLCSPCSHRCVDRYLGRYLGRSGILYEHFVTWYYLGPGLF